MVCLTKYEKKRLPSDGSNEFRAFKSAVKNKRDELESIKKGKNATSTPEKFASGSGISAVTCPGNILSDISRLEVLMGGARAGNNSVEIISEAVIDRKRLKSFGFSLKEFSMAVTQFTT